MARAITPPLCPLVPEPIPDAATAVLELQVRWGSVVLEVQHHAQSPVVTVGRGGDVHLDLPLLAGPPRPLFTCVHHQYVLHLPPGASGVLHGEDAEEPLVPGVPIPLLPEDAGELVLGGLVVGFRFNEPRAVSRTPWPGEVDVGWVNTLLTTLMAGSVVLALLVLAPRDARSLEADLQELPRRVTAVIKNPPVKDITFAHRVVTTGQRPAPAARGPSVPTPRPRGSRGGTDVRQVAQRVDALLGGLGVLDGRDNTALAAALEGVGTRVATAGLGGLEMRGGVDGPRTDTLGTLGTVRTRGGGGRWEGTGGLEARRERAVELEEGKPVVGDALDKGLVRGVIRSHLAQVKYCYERELTSTPGLAGRVVVSFTIDAQGKVLAAHTAESTLANSTVEQCITARVREWVFPKPRGGGIVVVSYPFILRAGS